MSDNSRFKEFYGKGKNKTALTFTKQGHINRIKQFIKNPVSDPIKIFVVQERDKIIIEIIDGAHRFLAAKLSKKEYIKTCLFGKTEHVNNFLKL